MKISYKNIPIDIVLCMLWSVILVPISLLDIEGIIRIIFGLPFIFFIPGYVLIFALFPMRKTDKGIDYIERIALSFGFSIALVSLICFLLNFTSWGIRLESILLSIFIFIMSIGFFAIARWTVTDHDKKFTISLDLSFLKSQKKLDYAFNIIIISSLIIACLIPIYMIYTPKIGEKFTEFYLVNLEDNSKDLKNLTLGVNTTRNVEIVNHEYETINYTVELWLLNYTQIYNESENEIQYKINNMWFIDKNYSNQNHSDFNPRTKEVMHRLNNFTFSININESFGSFFRLTFLLYKKPPTDKYNRNEDYLGNTTKNLMNRDKIAKQKISSAYREIHQWINVYYHPLPIANFTISPDELVHNQIIYFTSNSISSDGVINKWEWDFGDFGDKNNTSSGNRSGLEFDGIDDYIDCGNNSNLQPVTGTIEAWIYPKKLLGFRHIFTTSGDSPVRHPCFLLSDNALMLILTDNTFQEPHTYSANFQTYTWYHVAATWDGSKVSFYVNGALKETQTQKLIPAGNMAPKRIGALAPPTFPEAFNGIIKDVRIYNQTLNSTEIQENYKGNITNIGLVSWWKMNDESDIASDAMERNNGIIYGTNRTNQANHKYSRPGSYDVTLTITNEYGQINSIVKNIHIT